MTDDEIDSLAERLNKRLPTIKEIAGKAGVSTNTVWRLKNGLPVTDANALSIQRALDGMNGETG